MKRGSRTRERSQTNRSDDGLHHGRVVLHALEATSTGSVAALVNCCERRIDSLILGVITLRGLMLKATSIMVALAGGNLIVGLPSWQWLHPSSESVYL